MSAPSPLQPQHSNSSVNDPKKVTLSSYIGIDTLPQQIERKLLKRGFNFNVMVVGVFWYLLDERIRHLAGMRMITRKLAGQTGLGKSTLVNTLFASHLVDSKAPKKASDPIRQTTDITVQSHVIEENGVRVRLSIVDTPGFGDLVNNDNCWDPILKYIKDQYSLYLRKELTPARERRINDTRVHCVLYFISPTGHALRPLDILFLRLLSAISNVVPVIAKSDSLTMQERNAFKERIKKEIEFHGIRCYPYENSLIDEEELDRAESQINEQIRAMLPFAVVGSERNVVVDGKAVRGRRNRWGIVNVEDESHSDFPALRHFLLRTHMQDLIETTSLVHYENFRTKQLLALKESTSGRQ